MVYEFVKCHEAIRNEGDPPCAPIDEINTWLSEKSAHLRVLNQKVDFSKENNLRENEIWMPAV